jgi:hypothetical protein
MSEDPDDFYEDDEPVADVLAAFDAADEKGVTKAPFAKGGLIGPAWRFVEPDRCCHPPFIFRGVDPERGKRILEVAASWYRKPGDDIPATVS